MVLVNAFILTGVSRSRRSTARFCRRALYRQREQRNNSWHNLPGMFAPKSSTNKHKTSLKM